MRFSIFVLFAAGVCGCGGVERTNSQPADNVNPSAPAKEEPLAEEYDLGDYRIRPPKGFELKSDDRMPRGLGRLIVWRSPDNLRGFSVALITLPADEDPASPELIRIVGRTKGVNNYKESAVERCTLADMAFERCVAEYTHRNDEAKRSSIVYSQGEGRKGILIWYDSPAGEDGNRLAVATAAIQSFRKP
jgi:hypothetical protein